MDLKRTSIELVDSYDSEPERFRKDLDGIEFQLIDTKPWIVGIYVENARQRLSDIRNQSRFAKKVFWAILAVGFVIYFGFAMSKKYGQYPFEFPRGSFVFCMLTVISVLFVLWATVVPRLNKKFNLDIKMRAFASDHVKVLAWLKIIILSIWALVTVLMVILTLAGSKQVSSLQSLLGIILLPTLLYLTSTNPSLANFRIVFSGMALQFWMGLFVLRTEFGFKLIQWFADTVTVFLNFANDGASFVYRDLFKIDSFILPVTSIILYLSAVVSILYYWGAMQWLISKLAWLISLIIGTSAVESIGAAANVFLGQTEAPLLIKPYLDYVTPSEFHALMSAGFASVSGSVLGGYINIGINATHLITACFMAAPGALAMANLSYPDEMKTRATAEMIKEFKGSDDAVNVFDAALGGAVSALKLCGAILASLIAITSILSLLDSLVIWLFSLVGQENVSFQLIIGYLFYPFAYIIGIQPHDCLVAGRLFGIKTFLNEFIAFGKLRDAELLRNELIANKTFPLYYCGEVAFENNDTLIMWDTKSTVVMTYALCGFANFASVGIQLGGLTALAPKRKNTIAVNVIRAMITGIVANLLTASLSEARKKK